MNNCDEQVATLLHAAQRGLDAGASTSDFEPGFAALLDFIQSNSQHDRIIRSTVLEAMDRNAVSWELLSYLMYELRWPEVLQRATDLVARHDDWRVKTPLSHVMEAYDDDWPDADLYARWKAPLR